jgi:uncharacterized protein involved in exopolysaccharide biosynthesis
MSDPASKATEHRGMASWTRTPLDAVHGEASRIGSVKGIVSTLFTRKLSILVVALLVEIGIGIGVFWLLVPTYESKAWLHVDLSVAAMPVMRNENTFVSDIEKMAFFETVVQEIETPSIIEGVVRKLELDKRRKIGRIEWILDKYKDFKRYLGHEFGIEAWTRPPDPFGAAVAAIVGNLSTSRLENSTILELVYYAKDENECQETLAAIVDGYVDYRNAFIRDKATGGSKFLEPEIDRVRGELKDLEHRLLELMRQEAMPLTGSSAKSVEDGSPHEVVGVLSNPVAVEQMTLRLLSLQEELERIIADGREGHPSVKPLREMIDAYVEAVNKSPDIQQRVHTLHREIQAKEQTYNQLVSTHQATQTMSSEDLRRLNAIKVIRHASAPGGPVSPQRMVAMLSGLVLGLLLGVIYALIKEFLDTTIKSPEDIRSKLGLEHVISLKRS